MAEDKQYINPDNPVYFSYAWANDEHPDIEEDVNNLCKLLEENHIYYKRDKDNLCPYRWSIQKSEEEIGEGTAIIVVISERYLKSLHCMNEWHLIREYGNISKRVFPIVLEDARITDKKVFLQFYDFFTKRQEELKAQLDAQVIPLTPVEKEFVSENFIINDFQKLYKYLTTYNKSKLSLLQQDRYKIIIEQLKEHITGSVPQNNITASSTPRFRFYVPDGLIIELRKGLLEESPDIITLN